MVCALTYLSAVMATETVQMAETKTIVQVRVQTIHMLHYSKILNGNSTPSHFFAVIIKDFSKI